MQILDKLLRQSLRRYLARLLRRPEDIDDLLQEAYLKVLEAGSQGEIRHEKAYLFRTAHNLALNHQARKHNRVVDSLEDLLDTDVLTQSGQLEDDAMAQQRFEMFCTAAAELPERCRQVLILTKVYGHSQPAVAERLGISVSAVEKQLSKGFLHCRRYMASRGYVMEAARPVRKR